MKREYGETLNEITGITEIKREYGETLIGITGIRK
jgi:hypothetical protein